MREKIEMNQKMAAQEGQVIGCHSEDEWNEQFQKAKDSKKLVLLLNFTSMLCILSD